MNKLFFKLLPASLARILTKAKVSIQSKYLTVNLKSIFRGNPYRKPLFCFLQIYLLIFTLFYGCISKANLEGSSDIVSKSYSYSNLSNYQRSLFDGFIETMLPQGTNVYQVITDKVSIRSTTRLASALLFRNISVDSENAIEIVRWVLKHQYQEEGIKTYGMWKTNVANDGQDQNWREFIGCDLIIIYHKYKDRLPEDLLTGIETGLIHAARGAMIRDVQSEYTNISVMSAFLMNYVGTEFGIEELKNAGLKKARDIYTLYHRYNTFSEYNSPTYDGVTLIALSLWRELASGEFSAMGAELEGALWHEIATHYNPELKNMTGPHIRSYGMDMNRYYSITGICIAVALDEEKLAPIPRGGGAKYFEVSNIAPMFQLDLNIPKSVLKRLKHYDTDHFLDRLVPNKYFAGDSLKRITASINRGWMMGGMWGNRRHWNQIYPGTMHWKNANDEIGWLLVPGDGKTNVSVTKTHMSIYNGEAGNFRWRDNDFSIYVYSDDLSEDRFSKDVWILGKMRLNIESPLEQTYIKITEADVLYKECAISEKYPAVMKITFHLSGSRGGKTPLLKITPSYSLKDNTK